MHFSVPEQWNHYRFHKRLFYIDQYLPHRFVHSRPAKMTVENSFPSPPLLQYAKEPARYFFPLPRRKTVESSVVPHLLMVLWRLQPQRSRSERLPLWEMLRRFAFFSSYSACQTFCCHFRKPLP